MPDTKILRALFWVLAIIAVLGVTAVLVAEDTEAVASISLSIQGSDTQSVDPGSSATFKINVTNLLTTTTLTVNLTNSTPPTSWTAQLSQTQITVSALSTKSVTLSVGVPSSASADPVGKQVIVTAEPDFGDTEQITTTTKVSQTYGIQTSSTVTVKHTVGASAVTFSLRINNTGNGQDTVTLTHSGEPSTWTVTHVSSTTIPALSSKMVTVSIVPPSTAPSGTYLTTVKATSSDPSKSDETTFIVIIDKVYGLSLSSSDVSKYVTPKVPAYYNLSVTNTGNTADNAIITIVNAPTGWTVLPTSNPVALNPNETKDFQVLVTAPSTALAGTQFQIGVNATSNGNGSIVRQLSINAVVNQVYDPRITPLTNSKLVAPGDSVTFKLNVTNHGNGNDTMDLSLSGMPSGQGWVYNFVPSSVTLTPGETKTVDLTFTIGSSAAFGDNLVTVIATSHGTTTSGTTMVVVSVSQFYNLALVPVGAATKRVDPGGTLDFELSITNTGNGPDDFTLTSIGMVGTWVSYYSKTTVYNLPANTSETTTLTLEIPSTTQAGTYRFDVKATSGGNTSVYRTVKNITVIVNQLYAVSITPEMRFISGPPGTTIDLNLTVTNDGSGTDNLTVTVEGTYASWVTFNRTTIMLGPGASGDVKASIMPPEGTTAGSVTVTFRATSKGRTSVYTEDSVDLTVDELYRAKLTVVEDRINKKPTETATFTVQLKNDGNAEDTFKVNFTTNTRNLASHSLSSPFVTLSMGATRTFTVTVTVPSGEPVGNLVFVLLATSGNDSAAKAPITLTVVVDPVYGVNLFSYDATASAEPTDDDTVELRLENTGNTQDTFTLKATGPYYKWVSFEMGSVILDASTEQVLNMTVTVPDTDEVSTGTYYINVTATSTADSSATKTLEVTVTVVHKEDLDLYATDLIRRRWADPGDSVTYKVTVENLGLNAHVVYLTMSGDNTNWAKLSKDTLSLLAGGKENVTVTVTVPDGTTPTSFLLNVTGTFDDNTRRTDAITLTTTVRRVNGVKVELNDTTVGSVPGTSVAVTLTVNNTGNAEDTYKLSVDEKDDWVVINPSTVTLAPGANATVTVRITAPADPLTDAGTHYLNVTATSQGNQSVTATDMLEFEVEQVYAVKVKTTPKRASVDPGTSAKYNITLTNEGNGPDTFVFTLDGTRKAWGKMSMSQVRLDAGEERVVQLSVRIPSNQPVEDVDIIVEATSSDGENVTANVTTVTTINPYFGVDLTISNPSKRGFPGKWVAFPVKVKNTGNDEDTFDFEVTGDQASWVADLDPLTVSAGKIKTLDFNITPPSDVENGIYTFTVNASSSTMGDTYDVLELTVTIDVYHGLTITVDPVEVDSSPGTTETVLVYIENTGNVNDTFDLRAKGPYEDWVSIDNVTLDADEGDTVIATATILVNETTGSGDKVIRFEATSRAGGNVTEVTFTIRIDLRYGVEMFAVKEDTAAAPNTTVRVEVELKNTGNIQDTFELKVIKLPNPSNKWNATLEHEELTVGAEGTAFFNVSVDVPVGIGPGTYQVSVRATSTKATVRTISTIPLNITLLFNVSATGPSGKVSVVPGASPEILQIAVKNEGLGTDTFTLEVLSPHESWATPAVTHVELDAGVTAIVDVALTVPLGTEKGTYKVQIKATSMSDKTVSDLADIDVKVEQVHGLMVTPETWTVEGEVDLWHESEFVVNNTGNGIDRFSITPVVPSGSSFEARTDRSSIELDPGENATITLRVRADPDALAGSYALEVVVRSTISTSLAPARPQVTFTIPAEHTLGVTTSSGLYELVFDDTIVARTYEGNIEITNEGNIDESVDIIVEAEDASIISWFVIDTPVDLDAGTSINRIVTLNVPASAQAGTYTFEIVVTSHLADVNATLGGILKVLSDHDVSLTTDVTGGTVNKDSGQNAVFIVTVRNNGNTQETVELSVSAPTGLGTPVVEPISVSVPAFGMKTMTLTFKASAVKDSAKVTNAVSVKAIYDTRESQALNLVVDVLKPIISVDASKIKLSTTKPDPDGTVTVTVVVENDGAVAASGLTVSLLVDEYPTASQTGVSVDANSDLDVVLEWEVDSDPDSTVNLKVRIVEEDITVTVPTPVKVGSGEKSIIEKITTLPFLYVLIIGLVIGLIVGGVIAGGVRKRYKQRLEAARAAGMAEGMALADEEMEKEPEEEEEAAEGEGEAEEEAEEAEEEEEAGEGAPVTVQCPRCNTLNKVTTTQRPYEFRCEECSALLRLSR